MRAERKEDLAKDSDWIEGDKLYHENPDGQVVYTFIHQCKKCGYYFESRVPVSAVPDGIECGEC